MSVRAQRERHEQLKRERAVLRMRESVVSAITPAYLRRVGSSAIFEAVDEALAQIVAAGDHLREPDEVKALWITYARRRVIDGERSAEFKHRAAEPIGDGAPSPADTSNELLRLTDDARQWWRIREILSVLRGDQRRWAEAWYDHVLSASRAQGAQPRGLSDALGWTPSKTKSVSRRARTKMATFIDDRTSGAVCDEQRARLDSFILAGKGSGQDLDPESYEAILFHVAGCEDCWAAWHTRRRALLGRCGAILAAPVEAAAAAAQGLEAKLAGLAHGVHLQGASLLARIGIGGAAAAGGGAATIGGKTAAVCVGVVCAATAASGELAGVLRPVTPVPVHEKREKPERATRAQSRPAAAPASGAARHVPPPAPQRPASAVATSTSTAQIKAAVRAAPPVKKTFAARPADADEAAAAGPSETFGATGSVAPPPAAASSAAAGTWKSTCAPGELGC